MPTNRTATSPPSPTPTPATRIGPTTANGNRVSWTNRRRQTIWYTNDVLGRVVARAYPDGVVHTFNYDAQGNLAGYTDPLGATTQEFDADGRLAKITYPGNRWLGYTYDPAGRRALMTNELGNDTALPSTMCGAGSNA